METDFLWPAGFHLTSPDKSGLKHQELRQIEAGRCGVCVCTICRDVKLLNFAGGHRGPRGPVANEDTPWLPVKTYLLLIYIYIYIYMAQRSNRPPAMVMGQP